MEEWVRRLRISLRPPTSRLASSSNANPTELFSTNHTTNAANQPLLNLPTSRRRAPSPADRSDAKSSPDPSPDASPAPPNRRPPPYSPPPLPSSAITPPSSAYRLQPQLSPPSLSATPSSTTATAKTSRRTLLTTGLNTNGQLGLGDQLTRVVPQPVAFLGHTTLTHLVCGSRTTFAIDTDGRVFAWGKGDDGALGSGDRGTTMRPRLIEPLLRHRVRHLACRGSHVLTLTRSGSVWAWGRNEDGQLGVAQVDGQQLHYALEPRRVSGLSSLRIRLVACGRTHSVAVDAEGALYSWGGGDDGVLGHGDTSSRKRPTRCAALRGQRVVAVACGSRHTLALVAPAVGGDADGGLDGDVAIAAPAAAADDEDDDDIENGTPTARPELYSWGWGVYGQLGHGDTRVRLLPTRIESLRGVEVRYIACGYRHNVLLTAADELWAWGWGRHGQLGLGTWDDELVPKPILALSGCKVATLSLGGRHSLATCADGSVYAWGRDEEGQLGRGLSGSVALPHRVGALIERGEAIVVACGWSHSAILVEPSERPPPSSPGASALLSGGHSLSRSLGLRFVRGDTEGAFAQLLGTYLQFVLTERLLSSTCGFSAETLQGQILPGIAMIYVLGHVFFAREAAVTGRLATACPHGVNIVSFFAFSQLIMAPAYQTALAAGAAVDAAAAKAHDAGLCACFLMAMLELVSVPLSERLRNIIPRAAMLSAIAGVSLTFIAMGFAVQIWAAPGTAIVPMLLMLIFYGGQVKLPFRLPGGIVALVASASLAYGAAAYGLNWFTPPPLSYAPTPQLPLPTFRWVGMLAEPQVWHSLSVVVPMWLVNLISNLANLEAASAVGDHYGVTRCLLGLALIDLACVCLGNPFPSCIYIGHSAFKAMGARSGYLYLNLLPVAFFGLLQGCRLMESFVPIEGGVGFLFWIGLQITAQGFEGDSTPEGWRHGPAVALGLIPSIAAWSWKSVSATYEATRDMLCHDQAAAAHPSKLCGLTLREVMQRASSPVALDGAKHYFQEGVFSLYLSGMEALANGYLLSAIVLSSMLVHVIDGRFDKAGLWLLLAAVASAVGILHSPALDPAQADQRFSAMYMLASMTLFACDASQNRQEQLKEVQVVLGDLVSRLRGVICCKESRLSEKALDDDGHLPRSMTEPNMALGSGRYESVPPGPGSAVLGSASVAQSQRSHWSGLDDTLPTRPLALSDGNLRFGAPGIS